jgi:membrane-bound metal-dependent hydrolase YbcI (DUF457 family)
MCMAPCHRLGGFVAGAALAAATHQPLWVAVASAGIATVAAAGRLSPDVDQFKGWRLADKLTPDEMLGKGGPLQHRGITHFWGLPLAASVAVSGSPGLWIAWAALAGWVSHLLLDWAFGQADPWAHRGPGIPVWPWWGHVGLGLDAGGLLERFVLTPALVVAGAVVLAWPYAAPFVRTATTAWEATR